MGAVINSARGGYLAAQAATQATLARLSCETLVAVLRSDNLRVPSELHVFQAVIAWLEADPGRAAQAAEARCACMQI
jgi:hypothetical protein